MHMTQYYIMMYIYRVLQYICKNSMHSVYMDRVLQYICNNTIHCGIWLQCYNTYGTIQYAGVYGWVLHYITYVTKQYAGGIWIECYNTNVTIQYTGGIWIEFLQYICNNTRD